MKPGRRCRFVASTIASWYRHERDDPGKLVNDTGCGNTIACDRPVVRELILASLRHFAVAAGIDGFRFDLATTLGRDIRASQGIRRLWRPSPATQCLPTGC